MILCFGLPVLIALILPAPESAAQSILTPGTGISGALFPLREMDMHLHAGMERQEDLSRWIDRMVEDGRRAIVLLDHLELYRRTPEELAAWNEKNHFPGRYRGGPEGHRALMNDFRQAAEARRDVLLFSGWEISETELDETLEAAPMRMAEVIGWHISPRNGRKAPDGQDLLRRVRQIREAQNRFPVPMIVFHPFSMRLENLSRTASAAGRDPKTLSVSECRFFQPGEQEELAQLLRGSSIYIEMSLDHDRYWDYPAMREALIADIRPLAEKGVSFTIATDHHSVAAAARPFHPERYCLPCGVTAENSNTLIRELLAARARKALQTAPAAAPPIFP